MSAWASFLNGFLAIPFGIFEFICWGCLSIFGRQLAYHKVREVWLERSFEAICLYLLGQLLFLIWPLIPALLGWGRLRTWSMTACSLFLLFVAFTFSTLFLPIGARQRYKWLGPNLRCGYERLFLGQMPVAELLGAQGMGAVACLFEVLGYVILIGVATSMTQFGIWLYMGKDAFKITTGTPNLWTFVYWSAVTMSTTGFGDLAPKGGLAQLISVAQILLSWMYLVALLPTLVKLGSPLRGASQKRYVPNLANKEAIVVNAIQQGTEWLREQQAPWGGWRSKLSGDLAAAACTYAILIRLSPREPKILAAAVNIKKWMENEILRLPDDPVGQALVKFSLAEETIHSDLVSHYFEGISRAYHKDEHASFLLCLLGGLNGVLSLDVIEDNLPSDLSFWKRLYGPHWASYKTLADLMLALLRGNICESCEIADVLLHVSTGKSSWHGDVILTALVGLALNRLEKGWTKQISVAAWLMEVMVEHSSGGMPVVRGIEIWDTAWALSTLLYIGVGGGQHNSIRDGVVWLVKRSRRANYHANLWSWSDEGELACCDTSSLVCQVLGQLRERDVAVEVALQRVQQNLTQLSSNDGIWPTFVWRNSGFHRCPIISSRCLALSIHQYLEQQKLAEGLIRRVIEEGWCSEWFDDPAISQGLVLFYLARYLKPECLLGLKLAEELRCRLLTPEACSIEAVASNLLGLAEAEVHLKLGGGIRRELRLAATYLALKGEGGWTASRPGVFGFGRRYSDNVFCTSLAIQALARYLQKYRHFSIDV